MSKTAKTSEPKPKAERKPRAKKQPPTKAETLKLLLDTIADLKQIIVDLKDEQAKIGPLNLKRLPELITETLHNLEEDAEEMQEKHDELLAAPDA